MQPTAPFNNRTYQGMLLAFLATLIWSGNFIVARAVIKEISPISLAFLRWTTGTLVLVPVCFNRLPALWKAFRENLGYFFWVSFFGVTLFNTLVYVAGHHSPAINLALIGTTSSPIFATLLAGIFLKEKTRGMQLVGLLICIAGILLLLSKGNLQNLLNFRFTQGDWWVLGGSLSFAIYNIMVRRNPVPLKGIDFLFITFGFGSLLLLPFFIADQAVQEPVHWNATLVMVILYLGIGTSVLAYLCWNAAIARLGAARTALFGNLIPIFSTLEAVLILGEKIQAVHIISGVMVIGGLLISNVFKKQVSGKVIVYES